MTRNTVQKTASLHEKAVQAVAEGTVQPTPRERRKPRTSPGTVQPTFAAPKVDKRVWEAAKKILDSDHGYTRWSVLSTTEVVVR